MMAAAFPRTNCRSPWRAMPPAKSARLLNWRLFTRSDSAEKRWPQSLLLRNYQSPAALRPRRMQAQSMRIQACVNPRPARLELRLKYANCIALRRAALARPDVTISVSHLGRAILHWKASDAATRISNILGESFAGAHLSLEERAGALRLRGLVGLPVISRARADQQYFFVNGRVVRDKVLAHAVRAAYEDVLHGGRYPAFALFLELPPQAVDVNVHPAKTEVRFRDAHAIHQCVFHALARALARGAGEITPATAGGHAAQVNADSMPGGRASLRAPSGAIGARTSTQGRFWQSASSSVRAAAAAQPLAQYDLLFGQRPAPPAVEQANPVDGLEA